jgi:hypothetical protein
MFLRKSFWDKLKNFPIESYIAIVLAIFLQLSLLFLRLPIPSELQIILTIVAIIFIFLTAILQEIRFQNKVVEWKQRFLNEVQKRTQNNVIRTLYQLHKFIFNQYLQNSTAFSDSDIRISVFRQEQEEPKLNCYAWIGFFPPEEQRLSFKENQGAVGQAWTTRTPKVLNLDLMTEETLKNDFHLDLAHIQTTHRLKSIIAIPLLYDFYDYEIENHEKIFLGVLSIDSHKLLMDILQDSSKFINDINDYCLIIKEFMYTEFNERNQLSEKD